MTWLTTAPGKRKHWFGHHRSQSICGGHTRIAAIFDNKEARGDCARCRKLYAQIVARREAEKAEREVAR